MYPPSHPDGINEDAVGVSLHAMPGFQREDDELEEGRNFLPVAFFYQIPKLVKILAVIRMSSKCRYPSLHGMCG